MYVSFVVDQKVSAGGIIFQDENPTEVEVVEVLTGEEVIESFGGEAQMLFTTWETEVYLDGFRLSECQDMDEAIERATGWKLRYTRLDQNREPSLKRLGGVQVRTEEGITDISVWNVSITGYAGKLVKVRSTKEEEERIYAV